MRVPVVLFDKDWKIRLALLLFSFALYSVFLSKQFLHLNSLLSSVTLDSIKNYYTFVYHIRHDSEFLRFDGMNYPFSEHIIFSDCQPIVTFVLRLLPVNPDYLIGTMHGLLFASFIISPLVLYSIGRRLHLSALPAAFVAMGLAFLAPQFLKINAGHHALAYGCVIPFSILLCLRLCSQLNLTNALIIFFYHCILFLLHPYLGFSLSILTSLSLLFTAVFLVKPLKKINYYLILFSGGIGPMLFFSLFMKLTDHHLNRTTEPYGTEAMVENFSSILAPDFGPFKKPLESVTGEKPFHFEGHTYLGLATILLAITALVMLPKIIRKKNVPTGLLALFVSASIILFISFGWHNSILHQAGVKISAITQFRAVCRFAWIFYYVFPFFLLGILLPLLDQVQKKKKQFILNAGASVFLILCTVEGGAMIRMNNEAYWKFRNFFDSHQLTVEERRLLEKLTPNNVQAMIPLPVFNGGSEMYDRNGSSNSMVPSFLYSYHSGLPIMSTMMSRTSITETEQLIEVLNSYKKGRRIEKVINTKKLLVIKTSDSLLPDENRLCRYLHFFEKQDSLSFAFVSPETLVLKKTSDHHINFLNEQKILRPDLILFNDTFVNVFSKKQKQKYETICVVDSNQLAPGRYVLSLHYHYKNNNYRNMAADLVITEARKGTYNWIRMLPIRKLSGFYKDMGVFEDYIDILADSKYEFIVNMIEPHEYYISDFMVRPDTLDIIQQRLSDTLINNFPGR